MPAVVREYLEIARSRADRKERGVDHFDRSKSTRFDYFYCLDELQDMKIGVMASDTVNVLFIPHGGFIRRTQISQPSILLLDRQETI
jgi:hypothetical protein